MLIVIEVNSALPIGKKCSASLGGYATQQDFDESTKLDPKLTVERFESLLSPRLLETPLSHKE